jgi:molybdate transport repressor ModE-like protein
MMRVVPVISWQVEDASPEPLDARLLPILRAIADSGSLAAAVAACGVSYRAAWGLLRDYERRLRGPLVLLERGRGASLTALGEQVLAADRNAARRLETVLPGLAFELAAASSAQPRKNAKLRLRIAASHDLVLAALPAGLSQFATTVELETAFMGSLFALKEFAEGHAELAGFHVPIGSKAGWKREPFTRWLRPRSDRLIRFIDREQGLILPRGNPAGVRNLRDVARSGLRFVNRQRGSGTRLLIDRILGDTGIAESALAGYRSEEFTHAAVAATVASGGAEAGFGLRAAAAEYGLDFIPLARERYYLAVRANDLTRPAVAKLVEALQSADFARHVRRYAGCNAAGAGSVVRLDALSND